MIDVNDNEMFGIDSVRGRLTMNMTFGPTKKHPRRRSIVFFGFVVSFLFVGFASWPMPVVRADEPDSISPLVAESTAAIAVTDRQVSRYDFARTLFLAGQRARAQKEFQAIWNDSSEGGPPRHCIAFYLAMIARADGNQSVAGGWFDRARALATKDNRGNEDAAFYRAYHESSLYNERRRRDLMPGFTDPRVVMVSLVARQPATAAAPDHMQSREVYQQLVVRARTAYEGDDKSIPNRINLASALLLHAEFAARSKESLYVTANDHFSEGRMLYEQVKKKLVEDADAEKMVASAPRVAMRLDAVNVRFTAITAKAELSRIYERLSSTIEMLPGIWPWHRLVWPLKIMRMVRRHWRRQRESSQRSRRLSISTTQPKTTIYLRMNQKTPTIRKLCIRWSIRSRRIISPS